MPFTVGDPVPWFTAPTQSSPEFSFSSAAGRFVLLGFLPSDPKRRVQALKAAAAHRALFDDVRLSAFLVVRDPDTAATARDMRGLRWFMDPDGGLSRLYGAIDAQGGEQPMWILLDPTLRVLGQTAIDNAAAVFRNLHTLPPPAEHAGVPLVAPVLLVPRVFDLDLRRRLIALHDADGGAFTGVMRDVGERTEAVMDQDKKRRDVKLQDPELIEEVRQALVRRLFPQIRHAFQFEVTEIERYIVSRYDAAEGGVFRAHRDNTTRQTANRKFACSINLNDNFRGGDLRFPEFGPALHRPPAGGALVFSCALQHEVAPMTTGRRYAFLPFLFDEEGARILEAYRESLAPAAS